MAAERGEESLSTIVSVAILERGVDTLDYDDPSSEERAMSALNGGVMALYFAARFFGKCRARGKSQSSYWLAYAASGRGISDSLAHGRTQTMRAPAGTTQCEAAA